MSSDLPRTAIVTGAASGMGYATARRFLDDGYRVIGLDLVPADFLEYGDRFAAVVADVRSLSGLEEALVGVLQREQRVHAVANIAGVYPPTTLESYDENLYRQIFDINVLGILNVTRALRPYMSEGSCVINFASADAFEVSEGQLLYGASKAAVVMITKSLALELADARIRVNGIAPGWVNTPGNAATGRLEAALGSIPLGRAAEPEEVARWVSLLADETFAGYVTGETILLAGGVVLR